MQTASSMLSASSPAPVPAVLPALGPLQPTRTEIIQCQAGFSPARETPALLQRPGQVPHPLSVTADCLTKQNCCKSMEFPLLSPKPNTGWFRSLIPKVSLCFFLLAASPHTQLPKAGVRMMSCQDSALPCQSPWEEGRMAA